MEEFTQQPVEEKELCELGDDIDMEDYDDDDDEGENFRADYFKKRFLVKRKRLNEAINFREAGNIQEVESIEQSLANLSLNEAFSLAKSKGLNQKLQGLIQIRKLVSTFEDIPAEDIFKNDIVTVLVECLSMQDPEVQFEASWILTNIAAGNSEHSKALYNVFVHFALLKLFVTDCEVHVANQVLWAIGNFMADNEGFCYQCISGGIIEPLTKQMKRFPDNVELLKTASWVTGQMSHLKDSPAFKETAWDLFPILQKLSKQKDLEICTNAIWGLGYLTDNGVDLVMNFNKSVVNEIVPQLVSPSLELQAATLHFLANCVSGDDEITQKIIDCGVLKYMNEFLNHKNPEFVQEATWMISNILAGTNKQVDAVFNAGLMPKIIELLQNENMKIKEKAVWAVTNVPNCDDPKHIRHLLDLNVIPPLCSLLTVSKRMVLEAVLEAIEKILQQCENRREEIREKIVASGGLDNLQKLKNHSISDKIANHATVILQNLFG